MKVLGGLKRGLVFVVSAPAGTGKTTLVHMLKKEFSCVVESVSCTTRKPRPGEKDGVDYHFISSMEFEQKIQKNEFLEYAKVFGSYYGTPRSYIKDQQVLGKHVVLVIDTQGAMQLKKSLEAVFIFLKPPSMDALKERLSSRKSESSEAMKERLSWAQKEIDLAIHYDYQIVNDRLEAAYDVFRSIFIAEEHKTRP